MAGRVEEGDGGVVEVSWGSTTILIEVWDLGAEWGPRLPSWGESWRGHEAQQKGSMTRPWP